MNSIGNQLKTASKMVACEKHGEYESHNWIGTVWSKCPACTQAEQEAEKQKQAIEERRQRKMRWEAKIRGSGIPERFHTRTLDTYVAETPEQKAALEFAKDYAHNFDQVIKTGRSVVFIGNPGTGKTHLACGIALRIMGGQQRTALYITVQKAIRRIKDTWSKGTNESESQAIEAMTFPDLLIFDEVGVQYGSDFEKNILFDILNERYEKRKPTILMSNLKVEEVMGYLGDRVADRLREDGGEVIPFNWESHRGKV